MLHYSGENSADLVTTVKSFLRDQIAYNSAPSPPNHSFTIDVKMNWSAIHLFNDVN
jgi:hypothetical protein